MLTFQVILVVHMLLAFGLISLILMQQGKGADAGAAFGAGAAGSVFGARGSNTFMYKLTASIGVAFFMTSLTLAYLASNEDTTQSDAISIMEQVLPKAGSIAPNDVPIFDPTTRDVPSN